MLARLFRRLFLDKLSAAHHAGRLRFFGAQQQLADASHFGPLPRAITATSTGWFYAKRPFAGPEAGLAYLSRYTHRVAISNSRLIASDERGVTFKWKDYRAKRRDRYQTLTLPTGEFIRRFLIHVLPPGFHRIRHYGLFANHVRVKQVQRLRQLLGDDSVNDMRVDDLTPTTETDTADDHPTTSTYTCPACGAPMIIIETFDKQMPRGVTGFLMSEALLTWHLHCRLRTGSAAPVAQNRKPTKQQPSSVIKPATNPPANLQNQDAGLTSPSQ